MVITLSPPLQCAHLLPAPTPQASYICCGLLATSGIITPIEGEAWELLPICPQHIKEMAMGEVEAIRPMRQATKHASLAVTMKRR